MTEGEPQTSVERYLEVISRKTARHHVEHIYAKIGVSNRALAGLFAARHGLIGDF